MTNLPPVQELSEAIVTEKPWDMVHGFVENYEWRGDGDYTPSESECALIEDAMQGFLQLLQDRGYFVTELQHSRAAEAAAPEGWVLVPRRPDDRMLQAGRDANDVDRFFSAKDIYDAMLSASPASPSPATGVRVKALSWQMENVEGTVWTGVAPMSGQYLVKHNGERWECIRGMLLVGVFDARDEAKAAGQTDFEARVLSALVEQP